MSRIFLGDKNAFSVEERMKMNKKYIFKNAIIHISYEDISMHKIIKATETFMKKVLKENDIYGSNQTGTIREK